MSRIILGAQLLGALVFCIAATAIADPQQFVLQKDDVTATFKLSVIRVPGRLEYPNLFAKPGRQTLHLNFEWTPDLVPLARLATSGGQMGKRTIVVRIGDKRYQLKDAVITGIEWPEATAQYNPKELSVDKCIGLKMDTDVVDYREGGVNDTTHKRPFQGQFKGEIIGVEAWNLEKIEAFSVPIVLGSGVVKNNQGSMKVQVSKAAAQAFGWIGAGVEWTVPKRQSMRLTLLDSSKEPLIGATMHIARVRSLGFTGPEGRSLSCELMFDTFRVGPPGARLRGVSK